MVIQKLQEKLFILKGRTIGLLGLAFKPDTDDLRDAPSLHIAERLLQMGARVKAYDPVAIERLPRAAARSEDPLLRSAREAGRRLRRPGAGHRVERIPRPRPRRTAPRHGHPILVDGRNFFVPEAAVAAGFDYTGIGRCTRARTAPRADTAPAAT